MAGDTLRVQPDWHVVIVSIHSGHRWPEIHQQVDANVTLDMFQSTPAIDGRRYHRPAVPRRAASSFNPLRPSMAGDTLAAVATTGNYFVSIHSGHPKTV